MYFFIDIWWVILSPIFPAVTIIGGFLSKGFCFIRSLYYTFINIFSSSHIIKKVDIFLKCNISKIKTLGMLCNGNSFNTESIIFHLPLAKEYRQELIKLNHMR